MYLAATSTLAPTPVRAIATDDPAEILRFAVDAHSNGSVALATLVDIRGGAARALGSHVVVAADGRFCGYVSGGCVEAAVACEALIAMAEGRDRIVKFGDGSQFIDIVLPCGGGITIAIHLVRNVSVLKQMIDQLANRQSVAARYFPKEQSLDLIAPPRRSGWVEQAFVSVYRPVTRVVVSGQSIEAQAVLRLAKASGYDVFPLAPEAKFEFASHIDPLTAVVFLHHDLEAEAGALNVSLHSSAFYIGALGSTRTHRRRSESLKRIGWNDEDIRRIKAPIGSFGPTKDSTSLAISILSDIAASRLMVYE